MERCYEYVKGALVEVGANVREVSGKAAAVGTGLAIYGMNALAALPTAATDAITSLGTDGAAIQAAVWVPLGTVTAGFLLMKLFKRGTSKI